MHRQIAGMLDVLRKEIVEGSPYRGYLYAYPHKTAYREFSEPYALSELWRDERKDALFFYAHVPFCEMRCGFCNLFTATGADDAHINAYLSAVEREAKSVNEALGARHFVQGAIGGGTPTFLTARDLSRLFDALSTVAAAQFPISIETSPSRTTPDRLSVLKERGVTRVSIGVESFNAVDLKAMGRPARASDSMTALASLREAGFERLNVDLIYGAQGQTVRSFLSSVDLALRWCPEEIYLYPLYIRALTGLGKSSDGTAADSHWDDQRLELYRAGVDRLLGSGYTQRSMRHFERFGKTSPPSDYTCQQDGMVGLGPGARSYTTRVHYSTRYAVRRAATWGIIDNYTSRSDFSAAHFGTVLNADEQKRRFVIKSLLQTEGLDLHRFRQQFGIDATEQFPELGFLVDLGLAEGGERTLTLTRTGLERSDAIGPFLVSSQIERRMESFEWR